MFGYCKMVGTVNGVVGNIAVGDFVGVCEGGGFVNSRGAAFSLTPNTTTGINLAARALPLGPGDIVLVSDREFPANVYPWMNLAGRGVEYRKARSRSGMLAAETAYATRAASRIETYRHDMRGTPNSAPISSIAVGS